MTKAHYPVGLLSNGRGDWIRTSGLSVPNRALYQAEPRPEESQSNPNTPKPPNFARLTVTFTESSRCRPWFRER